MSVDCGNYLVYEAHQHIYIILGCIGYLAEDTVKVLARSVCSYRQSLIDSNRYRKQIRLYSYTYTAYIQLELICGIDSFRSSTAASTAFIMVS